MLRTQKALEEKLTSVNLRNLHISRSKTTGTLYLATKCGRPVFRFYGLEVPKKPTQEEREYIVSKISSAIDENLETIQRILEYMYELEELSETKQRIEEEHDVKEFAYSSQPIAEKTILDENNSIKIRLKYNADTETLSTDIETEKYDENVIAHVAAIIENNKEVLKQYGNTLKRINDLRNKINEMNSCHI